MHGGQLSQERGKVFFLIITVFLILSVHILSKMVHFPQKNADNTQQYYLGCNDQKLVILDQQPKKTNSLLSSESFYLLLFEKIPVNEASSHLLQTIPSVGIKLSQSIVHKREQFGRFDNYLQLTQIKGIGVKRAEHLNKYLSFN